MASANIIKDVKRMKEKLIAKAKKTGLYENFGQKEYTKLKDKWSRYLGVFSDITDRRINEELNDFDNWCMNFDLKDLKEV